MSKCIDFTRAIRPLTDEDYAVLAQIFKVKDEPPVKPGSIVDEYLSNGYEVLEISEGVCTDNLLLGNSAGDLVILAEASGTYRGCCINYGDLRVITKKYTNGMDMWDYWYKYFAEEVQNDE